MYLICIGYACSALWIYYIRCSCSLSEVRAVDTARMQSFKSCSTIEFPDSTIQQNSLSPCPVMRYYTHKYPFLFPSDLISRPFVAETRFDQFLV
jgi:hypothetical protein